MTSLRLGAAAALSLLAAAPLSAQTNSGGIASATISAATIEDGTSASIAAAIGYRFNPIVSLGIELMFVPRLTSDLPPIPAPISLPQFDGIPFPAPVITVEADGGQATIFTADLRLTIPTRSRRISPYLIGGAGAASVKDHLQYTVAYPAVTLPGIGGTIDFPALFPARTQSVARATTDFAAAFGGGISFLAHGNWSLDVDARYIGIFGQRDAHIGRYGGGITYRF